MMKRKILNAIGWGLLGAFVLGASAAFGYSEGWKASGTVPEIWPVYAVLGIWGAAGKGFAVFFLGSLFRSWLKSLRPNPHRKD